ncbi:hybrid sensor histidine kinase/response regulator [Flexithrix dorotheae]|uniref:hybrid sensor histidine kinase/response regulator n=1 Tax=Flexithrix dorotheae TaxID=70993 RepID=UPI00037DBCE0|nr:hybrid sensor histidine kinase/response regulator [Flexithrix dorotheae]
MNELRQGESKILYIDDEQENLDSFRLVFMEYYDLYLANNVDEGMRILEQEEIQVLLTDQRMPKMTGLELLSQVKKLYPDIVCMIITGYADLEVVTKAFNEVGIYQYIHKPWDEKDLKIKLDNALEKYRLIKENRSLIGNLQESKDNLEKKVEELDTFVYRASHDINGPLSSFLGLCELGIREFEQMDSVKYFQMLKSEANRMSRILFNLLRLNEIEVMEIVCDELNLLEIIHSSLEHINKSFSTDNHEINIEIDPNLTMVSDQKLVGTIMMNVIQNAILYTENNAKVSIKGEKNGNNQIKIQINDNGIGIDPKSLHLIYNKFFRGTLKSKGNGLGLYLTKLAIERLKGKIEVESTKELGTTFSIYLPINLKAIEL